jgi:hypothetical protein
MLFSPNPPLNGHCLPRPLLQRKMFRSLACALTCVSLSWDDVIWRVLLKNIESDNCRKTYACEVASFVEQKRFSFAVKYRTIFRNIDPF